MKPRRMSSTLLLLLSVVALLATSALAPVMAQGTRQEVDVATAVRQGLADVNVQASGRSYYGPGTLVMQATNRTDHPLTIVVPQGLRFRSMDIRYQDEIAAVTQRVDLAPGETKTTDLTSFCGNAHRSAPAAGAQYAIGEAENSRMRNLLATIEGRKQQDSPVGQWAVWTLTDNLSITPNDAALPSGWSSDAAAREILAGGPLSTSAVRWVILTGLARFLWWVLIPLILAALALWWWLSHRPQATAAGKPGARQGSVTPTQSLQKPVVGPSGADVTHGKGKPLKRAGRK